MATKPARPPYVPVPDWVSGYQNDWLRPDVIAGLTAAARPNLVALDLSGVFDLEYTALKMLTEAEKRQREHGVMLWLVGLNPEVLAVVQRSSLREILGRERMLFTLEVAVNKYLTNLATDKAS